jgi:hypothetical protein
LYEYDETGKLIKIRNRDLTTGRESIRYMWFIYKSIDTQ